MEAFLYQQPPFSLLDSLYLSNGELSNASSCFTNALNSPQEASTVSSLDDAVPLTSSEKKRKQGQNNGSCLTTGQLKGARESKSRRKKANGALKGPTEEEATNNEKPPTGYILVRARRGQAKDSHSLAERVRRERISERMKTLQGLVPSCDKVIGKALILDEIINYVQSLQTQIEFLSMKIASVNPIINFGVDFEEYSMMQPETSHVDMAFTLQDMTRISQPIPSPIQNSHIPLATFEGAENDLQVIDSHSSAFPLHGLLGSTAFSQDSSSFLVQVGDIRRGLPAQVELKNMSFYQ